MTEKRRLRLGIAGLGRAAALMLPSFQAHPHISITAAADPNVHALERFTSDFGGSTFSAVETMCASGTIDAIYVASPHEYHAETVIIAADYGIHAVVEKPMALDEASCEAMIAAADAARTTLIVGHTHAFDPVVAAMRDVINSGEIGSLRMVTNLVYTDFLYRPRRPEELDTTAGGGILYNQVPHSIDICRELDGGPVRSVRAAAGCWDPDRRTEGAVTAFLSFESGAVASIIYSGYDRFDSDELAFWIGESGAERRPTHGATRRALDAARTQDEELAMRAASGFAGTGVRTAKPEQQHQPHFGLLLASCESADLRPSADGVLVYDKDGIRELTIPKGRVFPYKDLIANELCDAVFDGTTPRHDGRWGLATVRTALAVIRSSREQREIAIQDGPHYSTREVSRPI